MKYKALLCDVDGTLVPNREDGMPSKKVIDAITKASEIMPVGIATARSYWQVAHILDVLSLSGPCIITGGAQIIDPKTRKTYIERVIAQKDVKKVGKIALAMGIAFTVADRAGEIPFADTTIPPLPLDMYTQAISSEKADVFMKEISNISSIASHKALAWGKSGLVHVIITHPKASKQDAVLEVANILKISRKEIIGVGEGYNDFPFLMSVGLKVAMGNAVNEVKEIADYIAPSVEKDGVANVIEKFILHVK